MGDDFSTPSDPFANPPSDPFAMPPMVEVAPEVPAPSPARKRRTGLLAAVAVVAVVGAIVGVVLATRGDSDAGYSLKSASSAAAAADKVAFEMSMSAMGTDLTMTARVDTGAGLMAMSADLPMVAAGGTLEVIFDIEGKRMLMDASALPALGGTAPTKWIGLDLTRVPGMEEQFGSLTGANPLDTAHMFETASDVKDLGLEDLDGESAKHYVVTVDVADAMAAQPGIFDQLGDGASQLPDTIDYDVWVTEDDQLRKLAFSLDLMGESVEMEMKVTAIGEIEPIVLPAESEITDMTDMLGG